MEVPIKYLQNVAPKFENITLQSTFGSISDGSLIGPTSASEFMESPRDLTSSDLPQSEESESSIGEGANVPPIFLHSFISPSFQITGSTIKNKEPFLNESLSDRE